MKRKNNKFLYIITLFVTTFAINSCSGQDREFKKKVVSSDKMEVKNLKTVTLGAGCFWCVEAIFSELKGVKRVESGYMGGSVKDPTYKEVCSGTTGHAEVAQISFDPDKVSLTEILEVFFNVHDPTTLNRQGGDTGTQYRSAIFYHSDEQKEISEEIKKELDASEAWDQPIVTEISEASKFYIAEDYHQNYNENNPDKGYCVAVIRPKLEKFRKVFKDKLKK